MKFRCWQRAIFPGGGPPSIFASVGLYDRVRDDSADEKVSGGQFRGEGGWFTYTIKKEELLILTILLFL